MIGGWSSSAKFGRFADCRALGETQFVYVSNQVAIATGTLTEWICNKGARLPVAAAGHATTAPPAGGAGAQTGDYVAVPTQGAESDGNEKLASIAASLPPQTSVASRALEFVKRDLRVKFGAIIVGLWLLNEVCE